MKNNEFVCKWDNSSHSLNISFGSYGTTFIDGKNNPTIISELFKWYRDYLTGNVDRFIDEAYGLYMPQVRSEIEQLVEFVKVHRHNALTTGKQESYNILEIGTKYGGTLHLWCSINPTPGLNVSIDMSDGGIHGGISDESMDVRDAKFSERFDNVHFIRGDSHSNIIFNHFLDVMYIGKGMYVNLEEKVIQYDKVNPIDFLFIDGDHSYEGVKQDFEMYAPFVRPGGIIAFHDINDTERHRERNVYVGKFWNEIKDKYEHYEFNANEDWAGIGVIVKGGVKVEDVDENGLTEGDYTGIALPNG